jgi:hypothetical protein
MESAYQALQRGKQVDRIKVKAQHNSGLLSAV